MIIDDTKTEIRAAARNTARVFRSLYGATEAPSEAWITGAYAIDSAGRNWPDGAYGRYEAAMRSEVARWLRNR